MSERKDLPSAAGGLDETDLAIIRALAVDGRMTNAALAARVGVSESRCLHRVRALRARGVITGFRADLDLAQLGLPLQAVVSVRLRSHNRDHVRSFRSTITNIPGILTVFAVAGADDHLLHVVAASPEELRNLVVEHINVHPAVRQTQTQLAFKVFPGANALPGAR